METSTLDNYVFRLKQIRVHLKANHDVDLDGDLVLSVFLAGLGDDYSPIKIVLEAKDDINLEEAIKVVKNFQLSTLEAQEQGGVSEVMVKQETNYLSSLKCFNCGVVGHGERDCKGACKVCKANDHTRYACPKRSSNKAAKGASMLAMCEATSW